MSTVRDRTINPPKAVAHDSVTSGPSSVKRRPISPELVARVRELFAQGADTTEISKMVKASEALVYNALARSQP